MTVVVKFNPAAKKWEAWFDGAPCVCYGGDFSMVALHQLLEGSDTGACDLTLHVDQDRAGSGVLICEVVWQPPDLLFRCERCNGKGEYVGLLEVEKCGRCKGRGWHAC